MIFRNPQYWKTTSHIFAVVLLSLVACVQATVQAQTSIVTGKVASVKGRAEISGNGRAKALAIVPGMNIEPGDLIETRGGAKVVINLSDGSQAIVQSKARVLVNDYHRAHSPREFVQITVGRAVFKIHKIGGKPNPYRVTTPTASIAVRGTRFSVKVQKGGKTRVAVYEGLVAVDNTGDTEPEVLVEPGEAVVVQKDEGVEFVPETEEEKKEAQECPDCKEEPPDENQSDKPEDTDPNASKEPSPTPTPPEVRDKSQDMIKPEPTPTVAPAESPTPLPESSPIPSPPEPSSTPIEPAKPEPTPTPPVETPPKKEEPPDPVPAPRPEPTPTPEPPPKPGPPQPESPIDPAPPPRPEPTPTPEPPPKPGPPQPEPPIDPPPAPPPEPTPTPEPPESEPPPSAQVEPPVLPDPHPSPPSDREPSEPPSDPYLDRRRVVTKALPISRRTGSRGSELI